MRIKIFILFAALVGIANAKFYHWSSLPTTCSNVTTITCPSGYSDNGSNCKKDISYTFYEYKCPNAQSSQNYNYIPQNTGGNCNKTDPNTSTVNSSTLDDACNSSTPPTNNCKREKFTCVADSNRPCAKVDNKWQCSPFACNNDLECGYATCNGLPTSNTAIMPYEYHPIEALTRSGDACIPIQCDADYEYDDGIATKVDKKVCDGEVVGGKCVEYEYADKIETTVTQTVLKSNVIGVAANGIGYDGCEGGLQQYNKVASYCSSKGMRLPEPSETTVYGNNLVPSCNNWTWNSNVINWYESHLWLGNKLTDGCGFSCGGDPNAGYTRCVTDEPYTTGIVSIKSCPDGYSEYGSTTQCRKEKDIGFKEYYYHTYQCPTDTNAFGETWELTEPNIERGCVDDTFGGCLNFDIETQRCKRKIHTCPNGSGTCTLDGNNKYTCSYDGCDAVRYPCIGQMCDLALDDRISFCEEETCPQIPGVYEKDGECKILDCPSNTIKVGDMCIEE